jgi:adenine-specific DNA-methyltransferase
MELPDFINSYGNPDGDPRGPYKAGNISKSVEKSNPKGKNYYSVTSPDGARTFLRQWHFDREKFGELERDKMIYWGKSGHAVPSLKIFLNQPRMVAPVSIIAGKGSAASANKELERLMGGRVFENPKPVELIEHLLPLSIQRTA